MALVLTLLGAVLGGLLARFCLGYAKPPRPLRHLTAGEYALVEAASLASYPRGGEVPPSGVDAGVPAYVDRYLDQSPPHLRRLMRLLLVAFEHATLIFPAPGRSGRRRFSSLSPDQQVAVLEAWSVSSLFVRRLVFTSLRAILTMGYFSDPAVLRAVRLAPKRIDAPPCPADRLYPRRIGELPPGEPAEVPSTDETAEPVPLDPDGPLDPAYAEETA